jgi:hypothetical protein
MNTTNAQPDHSAPPAAPERDLAPKFRRDTLPLIVLCGILATLFTLLAASVANAEGDAPTDTPMPIVIETVDEWSIGSGLLYWGMDCFAQESFRSGYLRRQPVAGGTRRTLETTDGSHCDMPFGATAQDDGLYYYDHSESRIERTPLGEPYAGQPVATPPQSDLPQLGAQLEATAGHIYWPVYFGGKILRAPRAGGEIEIVADGLTNPNDILVVGNTLYWTDRTGVWRTRLTCGALPCNADKEQLATFPANTTGHSLFFRYGRFVGDYAVYWVQRTASGASASSLLRVLGCNDTMPCPPIGGAPSTLYTPGADWELGGLVSNGASLFWSESYNKNGILDGKLKRRALIGGATEDIAVSQTYIDTRKLFIANGSIYFARLAGAGPASGIFSLPLGASAITRDLTVDALEVTQAIQNLANQAPLVAEKLTYVRAYGRQLNGPNSPTVEAWLVGKRNGFDLPGSPLPAVNGVRSLVVGGSYDRARLDDGWLFLLPAHWTEGAVTLEVQIDPRRQHTDPALGNNNLARTVTFQNQPPVCVWTVPVRTHTATPSIDNPNFWSMVDHFKRRWPAPDAWIFRDSEPVEELQLCWWGPFPHPCYGPYELEEGWGLDNGIPDRDKVIVSLWTRAQLSFNPDACDDIDAPVHFMGLVHPNANNGGVDGYASTVSNQSWVQLPEHTPNPLPPGWNAMREGSVMAQELAHNYGRKHVNCGTPDDIDTNYPYPPCQIADVGAESYYGFDVTTRQPIRPNETADFMSYANRSWVSDYTWRALVNAFASRAGSRAPTQVDQVNANSVFVSGWVDTAAARGAIATVLVLPDGSLPPATRQGQARAAPDHGGVPHAVYTLRFLDAGGGVLANQPLTLITMDDHVDDADSAIFSAVLPQPAGQVATIQLLADAEVIDTLTPGTNLPSVAIQQPLAGAQIDAPLVVAWTANDPDSGDMLLFTVQYSHDSGASWHTLVSDYPSDLTQSYAITYTDLGSLHGSAPGAARIRILASDGYNTGIATSAAFTVANRKPTPYIVAPGAGQTIAAGLDVVLAGGAADAEDGGLADAALVWAVDGLPTGSGAQSVVAGLAPGAHTAVLTATDAANNTATADLSFSVAPLAIPLGAAPLLDGSCDDAGYAAATQVQLAPYGGAIQATVRLVRSADHLWACFSGLQKGAADPGAFAGLRADVNHSRDALAQSSDYGFFVGEDGDVFTVAGNGAGGFTAAGQEGLHAQIGVQQNTWSGELRIAAAALGGWDKLVGLRLGHYWVGFQGDDYAWPQRSVFNQPNTWATTALGAQPVLTMLEPVAAELGAPTIVLTVTGSGFVSGTTVLWDGVALATEFGGGELLTATVGGGQVGGARIVQVSTRSPAPGSFTSSALPFLVAAPAPVIASLAPTTTVVGGAAFQLTVHGSNFAADAQVLWNGAPLITQVVGPNQLTAQVAATLIAQGQVAGIAVRNPQPAERISAARAFVVTQHGEIVYLPNVRR